MTSEYTGEWEDVEVMKPLPHHWNDVTHLIRVVQGNQRQGEMKPCCLHPFNHCLRELPSCLLNQMVQEHCRSFVAQYNCKQDMLEPQLSYSALDWCLPMHCKSTNSKLRPADADAPSPQQSSKGPSALQMFQFLEQQYRHRRTGDLQEVIVLLSGRASTGKSTVLQQVGLFAAQHASESLVPLYIRAIDLQALMAKGENKSRFASSWNWIDAYYCCVYGEATPMYLALRQILKCRRGLLLIDGTNQGHSHNVPVAGLAEKTPYQPIERHVFEVLVPQGHLVMVSVREPTEGAIGNPEEIEVHPKSFAGHGQAKSPEQQRMFLWYQLQPLALYTDTNASQSQAPSTDYTGEVASKARSEDSNLLRQAPLMHFLLPSCLY